eukprot:m.96180 g.96180  ORF g.96180 m.96180 type:complete len:421 (+) comp12458_c0_seq1:87-1349(+)
MSEDEWKKPLNEMLNQLVVVERALAGLKGGERRAHSTNIKGDRDLAAETMMQEWRKLFFSLAKPPVNPEHIRQLGTLALTASLGVAALYTIVPPSSGIFIRDLFAERSRSCLQDAIHILQFWISTTDLKATRRESVVKLGQLQSSIDTLMDSPTCSTDVAREKLSGVHSLVKDARIELQQSIEDNDADLQNDDDGNDVDDEDMFDGAMWEGEECTCAKHVASLISSVENLLEKAMKVLSEETADIVLVEEDVKLTIDSISTLCDGVVGALYDIDDIDALENALKSFNDEAENIAIWVNKLLVGMQQAKRKDEDEDEEGEEGDDDECGGERGQVMQAKPMRKRRQRKKKKKTRPSKQSNNHSGGDEGDDEDADNNDSKDSSDNSDDAAIVNNKSTKRILTRRNVFVDEMRLHLQDLRSGMG